MARIHWSIYLDMHFAQIMDESAARLGMKRSQFITESLRRLYFDVSESEKKVLQFWKNVVKDVTEEVAAQVGEEK